MVKIKLTWPELWRTVTCGYLSLMTRPHHGITAAQHGKPMLLEGTIISDVYSMQRGGGCQSRKTDGDCTPF